MRYRPKLYIILLASLLFYQCGKEDLVTEPDQVSIRVSNHLSEPIDTFNYHFQTLSGPDSLQVTGLEPQKTGEKTWFENLIVYRNDTGEQFLVKKGYFKVEAKAYYVANCLCDPGLVADTLETAALTISVESIDTLRQTVNYYITQE